MYGNQISEISPNFREIAIYKKTGQIKTVCYFSKTMHLYLNNIENLQNPLAI